jgi:hypothetical protein
MMTAPASELRQRASLSINDFPELRPMRPVLRNFIAKNPSLIGLDGLFDLRAFDGELADLRQPPDLLLSRILSLPLVTASSTDVGTMAILRIALRAAASVPKLADARADLLLERFETLLDRAHRTVYRLADQAIAAGCPALA